MRRFGAAVVGVAILLCGCAREAGTEVVGEATDTTSVATREAEASSSTVTLVAESLPPPEVVPLTCPPIPDPDATIAPPPTDQAAPVDPSDPCFTVEAGALDTPTADIVATALTGQWRLCGAVSVFGTAEGGLEIAADGTWWKLDHDYSPMAGWGNGGSWELIDTSVMNGPGHFQLNLVIDGQGTVITSPVFTPDAGKMRLNNNGVYVADYVRLSP